VEHARNQRVKKALKWTVWQERSFVDCGEGGRVRNLAYTGTYLYLDLRHGRVAEEEPDQGAARHALRQDPGGGEEVNGRGGGGIEEKGRRKSMDEA
jgi:hypothetical protein